MTNIDEINLKYSNYQYGFRMPGQGFSVSRLQIANETPHSSIAKFGLLLQLLDVHVNPKVFNMSFFYRFFYF